MGEILDVHILLLLGNDVLLWLNSSQPFLLLYLKPMIRGPGLGLVLTPECNTAAMHSMSAVKGQDGLPEPLGNRGTGGGLPRTKREPLLAAAEQRRKASEAAGPNREGAHGVLSQSTA